MPRHARLHSDGHWYHVGNRGARSLLTYADDDDRRLFLSLTGANLELFGVETHAYALMRDHYHFMTHAPEGNLADAMHRLSTIYTQRFNKKYGLDGSLFKERYWSAPIVNDQQQVTVARYIELNPKAIVGIDALSGYSWSSLGAFTGDRAAPLWLRRDVIDDHFGGSPTRYADFVERHDDLVLDRSHHPPWDPAPKSPLELIDHTVALVADDRSGPDVEANGRGLRLILAAERGGATSGEIAGRYGLASPSAARAALHRFRQQAAADPTFASQLRAAEAMLDSAA